MLGMSLGAAKMRKAIPIRAMGTPSRDSSNIPRAPKPYMALKSLIIILVEVPISVQVPAKMEAYEIGIKNFEGLKFSSQLRPRIMGIKRTTTGVLLIKAEASPTMA
jgi:hypothetical protein